MSRRIVGIHVHHSIFLDDALAGAVNFRAGLRSAIQRAGDPELIELAAAVDDAVRAVRKHRDAAKTRLAEMPVEQVVECREGRRPWPDEIAEGFEPRCSCYDRCAIHDLDRDSDQGWVCNCRPCPAHPEAA